MMKYMALMAAFMSIGTRIYTWLKMSQADASPGGDDLTAEELQKLGPMLEEAINTGLMSAEIPVMVQITIVPIE